MNQRISHGRAGWRWAAAPSLGVKGATEPRDSNHESLLPGLSDALNGAGERRDWGAKGEARVWAVTCPSPVAFPRQVTNPV